MSMRMFAGLLMLAVLLAAATLYLAGSGPVPPGASAPAARDEVPRPEAGPGRVVLDISVHTLEELRVLLDRAEQLSSSLSDEQAAVVLVLHGPEVEFFAAGNYPAYKDVVDQAQRLDAGEIVDVKICQTMMNLRGVPRDDIPDFIEQVPDGAVEIERLVREGYVYF